MFPPMVDMRCDRRIRREEQPCGRAAALIARFGKPGSTTATRETGIDRSMIAAQARGRDDDRVAQAIVPPERPVPAPRGMIATPARVRPGRQQGRSLPSKPARRPRAAGGDRSRRRTRTPSCPRDARTRSSRRNLDELAYELVQADAHRACDERVVRSRRLAARSSEMRDASCSSATRERTPASAPTTPPPASPARRARRPPS